MDSWRVAVLGDGGVGKTALAVQVCPSSVHAPSGTHLIHPPWTRAVYFELLCW